MRERHALAALALALAGAAAGAQPQPRDLPPEPQAMAWIEADPSVQQALQAATAAGHAGAAIAAGPQEWSVRLQSQRRTIRDIGARSNEWLTQVERPVRTNGKSALDRQLGELERDLARARLGEARHEAARDLADLWLDVIAARLQDRLWQDQVGIAKANLDAVERRRRAGDASQLDTDLARADLADVQRQASLASTQLATATAALRVRFPQAEPVASALSEPQALEWDEPRWRERIVGESDPLKAAQLAAKRARTAADRASAERVPDPTVGVYTASESQRNERIVGLTVTIPLGGEYRRERASQFLREADAAESAAALQRQRIELEVARTFAQARGAGERWKLAEQSAGVAQGAARLVQRAYTLGETDLQALLLARRQAMEAQRAALDARAEALRGMHRLLVDAHLIWGLDKD